MRSQPLPLPDGRHAPGTHVFPCSNLARRLQKADRPRLSLSPCAGAEHGLGVHLDAKVAVALAALAVVVGFYVIWHVHHALHTPLMSVTNAISGIIVVGALLQIGHDDALVTALAFVAILVASINVFGGFAVTRRMLGMFTRGPSAGSAAR